MITIFSTIGIVFSTIDIIVRPLFHIYNGSTIYFTLTRVVVQSKKLSEWGLLLYAAGYSLVMSFLSIQFIYRMCVVVRAKWISHFDSWKLLFWLGYVATIGAFWVRAASLVAPNDFAYSYVRYEILDGYGVEIRGVPAFIVMKYDETSGVRHLHKESLECIVTVVIVVSLQYSIVLICGALMYRKTRGRMKTSSSAHDKLQKQLIIALIYQVCAPTLIFHLPAFFTLIAPYLDLEISCRARIVIIGMSAYPLFDTFIIFNVITEVHQKHCHRSTLHLLRDESFKKSRADHHDGSFSIAETVNNRKRGNQQTLDESHSSLEMFDLLEYISRIFYLLTLILNSSLIFLTHYYTRGIRSAYKRMIICFALIGITFATLDRLVRPLFHSYNGSAIYFTLDCVVKQNKRFSERGLLLYSSGFAMILTLLSVQFMYRACVVAKQQWVRHFDGWKYLIWMLYVGLQGYLWAEATNLTYPSDEAYNYVRYEMISNYGVEIRGVPSFIVLAYEGKGDNKHVGWASTKCIVIVVALMSYQYLIVLLCGYFMFKKTKETSRTYSTAQEKLQKELFLALIYQVIAPTIFIHAPALAVLLLPYLDLNLSFRSKIVIHAFSAYPLIDTLIMLKVISEFRNAYRRFMKHFVTDYLGWKPPGEPIPATATVMDIAVD